MANEVIKLGFDEEDPIEAFDAEQREKELKVCEKHVEAEIKPIVFSEKRLEELRKEFEHVVVNDFGDDYHLSDEQKKEKSQFYDMFKKVANAKRKYSKVQEYVVAVRNAWECLNAVAATNGRYTAKEFRKLFYDGKIYITGLTWPELVGRAKKSYDPKYLASFIASDEDPSNIRLADEPAEFLSEEELERCKQHMKDSGLWYKIFPDEAPTKELRKKMRKRRKKLERYENDYFDPDTDSTEGTNIITRMSKKEEKDFKKVFSVVWNDTKAIEKAFRRRDKRYSGFAFEFEADTYAFFEKYDKLHNVHTLDEVPEFTGDVLNKKDYRKYMEALDEWEDNNIMVEVGNRMYTKGEAREIRIKNAFEQAGWNLRAMYNNKEIEEKTAKQLHDKELEELDSRYKVYKLHRDIARQRGIEFKEENPRVKWNNEKKKERKKLKKQGLAYKYIKIFDLSKEDKEYEKSLSKAEKKARKKNSKKKDKDGKKIRKQDRELEKEKKKVIERYKDECNDHIDDILLDHASAIKDSWESWENDALDFTWDRVMKG